MHTFVRRIGLTPIYDLPYLVSRSTTMLRILSGTYSCSNNNPVICGMSVMVSIEGGHEYRECHTESKCTDERPAVEA